MGVYFTPWRRKIGVVTLVVACVVTMEWISYEQPVNPNAQDTEIIPHWILAPALTLVSAWLLLRKPRASKKSATN